MIRFSETKECFQSNEIELACGKDFMRRAQKLFQETPDAVAEVISEGERVCFCYMEKTDPLIDKELNAIINRSTWDLRMVYGPDSVLCLQDAGEWNCMLLEYAKKHSIPVVLTGCYWECVMEQPEVMRVPPERRILVDEGDAAWIHETFIRLCMKEAAQKISRDEDMNAPCKDFSAEKRGQSDFSAQDIRGDIIQYEFLNSFMDQRELGEFVHIMASCYGRGIAAVYGNCHFHVLVRYLEKAPAFMEKYLLVWIPPIFDMEQMGITELSETLLGHLDLLIYQNILADNLYGKQWSTEDIKARISETCKKVCIPNTVFLGYFPQEGRRPNTVLKNQINKVPMFCGDKYIEYIYRKCGSISETIRYLSQEDAIPEDEIMRNLNKALRMLELQDMGCDIPMKDYVISQYRKQYLFTEPKHPVNCFFKEMTERILRHLGLDAGLLHTEELDREDTLSTINRLLYPAVRRALHLEFTVSDYYCDRRITDQKLTFAEFIEVYIRNTFSFDGGEALRKER